MTSPLKRPFFVLANVARNLASKSAGPAAKIVPSATLNEDESFVDMDTEKLLKYCCINYLRESEMIELKADALYPSWLWDLRLGEPPNLDELDPKFYPYWQKMDKIYEKQLEMRKDTRFKSRFVQMRNIQKKDEEFFEKDEERSKDLH